MFELFVHPVHQLLFLTTAIKTASGGTHDIPVILIEGDRSYLEGRPEAWIVYSRGRGIHAAHPSYPVVSLVL